MSLHNIVITGQVYCMYISYSKYNKQDSKNIYERRKFKLLKWKVALVMSHQLNIQVMC